MIRKFIPQDFEECLMGLPIFPWIVDDIERVSSTRPVLVVDHLEALKGIRLDHKRIGIKAYTDVDIILETGIIPDHFKEVLMKARLTSLGHHTLGSYMNANRFTSYLFPMLIALNARVTIKSYMQERSQELSLLVNKRRLKYYNEIIYELVFDRLEFNKYFCDHITIMNHKVYYFIAYNHAYDGLKFVLMLPNRRIVRFTAVENGIHSDVLEELFISELTRLNIASNYRALCLEFFRIVFIELLKG